MAAFIRRHPAGFYFILAFALSWGGVLAVITPGPIPAPPRETDRLFVFVYLAMLVGPPVAGIVTTAIVAGKSGLRALLARLATWRVPARWYAIALLTAPLALAMALLALSPVSREFRPAFLGAASALGPIRAGSTTSFLLFGLGVGIGAGFCEEIGWTGFALPNLRSRRGTFAAALIVGVLWGAWHFLAVLWGSGNAFGSVPTSLFMVVALFSFLPPYRVLMARVYDRTRSLLIAVLMHASLTTSMVMLAPPISGSDAVVYDLAFGSSLWVLVAIAQAMVRLPSHTNHERRRQNASMTRSHRRDSGLHVDVRW